MNENSIKLTKIFMQEIEHYGSPQAFLDHVLHTKIPKKAIRGKKLLCRLLRWYIHEINRSKSSCKASL